MSTGKYDEVLSRFVALMEKELHANTHKGDREAWLNLTRDGGMFEVYDHSAKLAAALRTSDTARIIEHAADTANACMMLLDAFGLLVPTECNDNMCACRGGPCAECSEGRGIARLAQRY